MTRFTLMFAVVLLGATALQPREARACGGAFWSVEDVTVTGEIDAQRTLLIYDGTIVRHFVQVAYGGDPKAFAWVYPLPANPEPLEEVVDGDALFAMLDEMTKPKFHLTVIREGGDSGGGCAFGCPGAAGDGFGLNRQDLDGGSDSGVTVWGGGQVGVFDYVVITAPSIDPMQTWLSDNGFAVPATALPVLEHYVTEGFYFVAMKVDAEAPGVAGEASTSTVLFRYPDTRRIYPLHMASIGAAADTSVVLYVVDVHRAQAGPYPTVEIDPTDLQATESGSTYTVNYDELFDQAIAGAGGAAFVTEYCGQVTGLSLWSTSLADLRYSFVGYLTRLRTKMSGERMVNDVEITPAPSDMYLDSDFELTLHVASRPSSGSPDVLLALSVPAVLAWRGRRRSSRLHSGRTDR